MEVQQKGYDGIIEVQGKGRMGLWRFRRRVEWVYGGLGEVQDELMVIQEKGIGWVYGDLGEGQDVFMEFQEKGRMGLWWLRTWVGCVYGG